MNDEKPTYNELLALLEQANAWLNDYDLRLQGSARLADKIDQALKEAQS